MSSEMIERVARTLADHYMVDPDTCWPSYQEAARAAIEATREPGLAIRKITTFEFAEVEWPKLIDAALAAPPVGGTE